MQYLPRAQSRGAPEVALWSVAHVEHGELLLKCTKHRSPRCGCQSDGSHYSRIAGAAPSYNRTGARHTQLSSGSIPAY